MLWYLTVLLCCDVLWKLVASVVHAFKHQQIPAGLCGNLTPGVSSLACQLESAGKLYLEGQADLVSRSIPPGTHVVTPAIPLLNLLTKSPGPLAQVGTMEVLTRARTVDDACWKPWDDLSASRADDMQSLCGCSTDEI